MSHVFISHRSDDNLLAEKLAEEVRANGHEVWLDIWELNIGDSILGRMNAGLTDSVRVVMCYSTAGVDTPWMSREWLSVLARQLNGAKVKLLPVMLSGGRPPALLADIKYADLVSDWDAGMKELLRALQ